MTGRVRQHDGVLHVTGRDVEEAEIPMRQDPDTKHWHKLNGAPADYTLGETRAAILRYVREHPASTPKEITGGTSLAYETVRKTCARMATDGQLTVDAASRYAAPGGAPDAGGVPGVPGVPAVRRRPRAVMAGPRYGRPWVEPHH